MARNKYDIDETLHTPFNRKQFARVIKYISPYKKNIVLAFIAMVVAIILGHIGPYIFSVVLDDVIPNKDNLPNNIVLFNLFKWSFLYISCLLMGAFFGRFRILLVGKAGQGIIRNIRKDLFCHLQKLPFTYYDDRPHGKILVRVVNYVNTLSDLLSNGIVSLLTDLFSLIVIVFFMFMIDSKLAVITLTGLPFLIVGIFIIKTKLRKTQQALSAKSSNVNAYVHESICGMKVTQSFVREEYNKGIFHRLGMQYKKAWYRMVFTYFLLLPLVEMTAIFTNCFVYFCATSVEYFSNGLKVGVIVAFGAYISSFWSPIQSITNIYNQVVNATAYLERIFETIDEPITVSDIEDADEIGEIKGNIEFNEVSFAYEENVNILENISFKVKAGDKIALVGPTGAGKTTIVNLLSRFYNIQNGKILIDNNDISKVTLKSLRSQMGIMLQDPFLFSGTIMENIRYSKLDATDEQVIEAAKAVNAHNFIVTMSDGYYTEVNERGSRLSSGQRQLIAFARAILADPRIMILDEATASIDTKTEQEVQEGMEKLLKGRTSFIIAHRLSTIRDATCIMYIDKKGIQEYGNHDELIALKGNYYNLYMSQYLAMEA